MTTKTTTTGRPVAARSGGSLTRIVLWAASTLTVLVLLFGYHTSTSSRSAAPPDSAAIAPIAGGGLAPNTAGTSPAGSGTGSATATGSPGAAVAGSTVLGRVAQTRWGPVQVQIEVTAGRIGQVSVVQYPNGNGKDAQINARAIPVLISETLSAQGAGIDMVSGATITSQGYVTSLQSALDQAGL